VAEDGDEGSPNQSAARTGHICVDVTCSEALFGSAACRMSLNRVFL